MIKHIDQINEINKKISIRNKIRDQFVTKDNELSALYGLKMQRLKKKTINFLYYFLYCIIGLLIILLNIYKKLNQKDFLIGYGILIILSFIPLVVYFLKRKKVKELYDKYKSEIEENNKNKDITISLNLEIATSGLSIICLNENYYELMNIKNEDELIKRWIILINEYIDALNLNYNNDATIEDYVYYYQKWLES